MTKVLGCGTAASLVVAPALLVSVLVPGCSTDAESQSRAPLSTNLTSCTTRAPCNLSIPLLSGPARGQFVLQANGDLVLGDRSQVVDASGAPLAIVNAGAGSTNVGSAAHTATVVSQAPVTLRSGAER